jgi:hypothetical protein
MTRREIKAALDHAREQDGQAWRRREERLFAWYCRLPMVV